MTPQSVGPGGRPRPPARQGRPAERPGREGSASRGGGEAGAGGSVRLTHPPNARRCGSEGPRRGAGEASPGAGAGPGTGARGALTSCSAQRQMSEQRPVQQPMVPAASKRHARGEICVLRRRCSRLRSSPRPALAGPGPGSPAPRPALAALGVWASAPPLLVSRAGRGQS